MDGSDDGFTGSFSVTLDRALRLRIPAKFREVLAKRYGSTSTILFLAPWQDMLKVLPEPAFSRLQQSLSNMTSFCEEAEMVRLFLVGNMACLRLDTRGRIRLTERLCEIAEIKKDVVVVGQGDRMEIWSAKRWREH